MEAKNLTVNRVKNLVNSVKAIYRLNGFVTGKRTNLQKAAKECRFDYAELGKGIDTSLSFPESVFEKEYRIDTKAHFDNNGACCEIWFEDSKCYLLEMYETKYLIVTSCGYCNVYRLIEKTESEKFEDQPAVVSNGDSKKAVLDCNDNKIELTCTLSNTKVCKWDNKYPESHNHYIVTVSYEGKRLSFNWFDSFHDFRYGIVDKNRKEMMEMFYSFLRDIIYKNEYSDKNDFCKEEGNVPTLWSALCKHENKYNRVFDNVDIYELVNYLQETFELQ